MSSATRYSRTSASRHPIVENCRLISMLRECRDGPILNVDDDAYILPELLRKVWKVKKVTAWQVGNFGLHHKFGGSQCKSHQLYLLET